MDETALRSWVADHLLTASGRIGRRSFAPLALGLLGLWQVYQWQLSASLPSALNLIIGLMLTYLGLCLLNQRLHDLGRSGWWAALPLISLYGLAYSPALHHAAATGLILLALIITFSLIPGNRDHNRYGPVPGFRTRPLSPLHQGLARDHWTKDLLEG